MAGNICIALGRVSGSNAGGSTSRAVSGSASNMVKEEFEETIVEFPAEFKSLKGSAEELHGISFPIRDGALFTGIYRDPDKLYRPMIKAVKRAIASYRVVDSA